MWFNPTCQAPRSCLHRRYIILLLLRLTACLLLNQCWQYFSPSCRCNVMSGLFCFWCSFSLFLFIASLFLLFVFLLPLVHFIYFILFTLAIDFFFSHFSPSSSTFYFQFLCFLLYLAVFVFFFLLFSRSFHLLLPFIFYFHSLYLYRRNFLGTFDK